MTDYNLTFIKMFSKSILHISLGTDLSKAKYFCTPVGEGNAKTNVILDSDTEI